MVVDGVSCGGTDVFLSRRCAVRWRTRRSVNSICKNYVNQSEHTMHLKLTGTHAHTTGELVSPMQLKHRRKQL